jgi:hypothetical protein
VTTTAWWHHRGSVQRCCLLERGAPLAAINISWHAARCKPPTRAWKTKGTAIGAGCKLLIAPSRPRFKTHSAPHGTLCSGLCVDGRLPNSKQCDPFQKTCHTDALVSAGVVDCIDSTSSGLTSKIGKPYEKRVDYITLRGGLPSNPSGVLRQYVSRNATRVSLNIKRVDHTSSLVSVCDLP